MARYTVEYQNDDGSFSMMTDDYIDCDTYENLKARQGNRDLPHFKCTFIDGKKIELKLIDGIWFRTIISWD